MGTPDFDNAVIETPSGLKFRERDGANPNEIIRQEGETVRGQNVPGAMVIEEPMAAGQPEIIEDKTEEIEAITGLGNDAGCACDANGSSGTATFLLLGVLLLPLVTRRRRRTQS